MSRVRADGLATYAGDRILDTWFPRAAIEPKRPVPFAKTDPRREVTVEIDLDQPPQDVPDAYLRLHLLSMTIVKPHAVNLDGLFRILPNNAWTNRGPVDPADLETIRLGVGEPLLVHGLDKFPRLTDYVAPDGVRIADANRVRLGAHLAPGTTVMHEGFVNFNAGTLGESMVEGRVSSGVVVGNGSDVGGGASIMGTLSGGGTEVISVGEGCLIGANAGLGISLGDRSVVEAGVYVTAGSVITLPDGATAKGRELSGQPDLLFRRHSVTGRLEAVARSGDWGGLNQDLHAN